MSLDIVAWVTLYPASWRCSINSSWVSTLWSATISMILFCLLFFIVTTPTLWHLQPTMQDLKKTASAQFHKKSRLVSPLDCYMISGLKRKSMLTVNGEHDVFTRAINMHTNRSLRTGDHRACSQGVGTDRCNTYAF